MKDISQIAVRAPTELRRRLKVVAAREGISIQGIVLDAINQYLAANESGQAVELSNAMEATNVRA